MEDIRYAIELEKQIRHMLDMIATNAGPQLAPLINLLQSHHKSMIQTLHDASQTSDKERFKVDPPSLAAEAWQKVTASVQNHAEPLVSQICLLWALQSFYDKSSQYYRQAAANTPVPAGKYFFASAAEIKGMVKRRLDAIVHMVNNEVWGKVGFAPYLLGKE